MNWNHAKSPPPRRSLMFCQVHSHLWVFKFRSFAVSNVPLDWRCVRDLVLQQRRNQRTASFLACTSDFKAVNEPSRLKITRDHWRSLKYLLCLKGFGLCTHAFDQKVGARFHSEADATKAARSGSATSVLAANSYISWHQLTSADMIEITIIT